MGALAKLLSCFDKILYTFFMNLFPEILRLIILATYISIKHCKHLISSHKYTSMINKKSRKRAQPISSDEKCSICLSEFGEGDEVREVVDCRHVFHSDCLEKWLRQGFGRPTCPLCRSVVVPEAIVAEYHQMQIEKESDADEIEKQLVLILLKAMHGGSCYGLMF